MQSVLSAAFQGDAQTHLQKETRWARVREEREGRQRIFVCWGLGALTTRFMVYVRKNNAKFVQRTLSYATYDIVPIYR